MKKIISGSFSEACCNSNSIRELEEGLQGQPDKTDMKVWDLTVNEWTEQIKMALEYLKSVQSQKKGEKIMNDNLIDDRFDAETARSIAYNSSIISTFDTIKSAANNGNSECRFTHIPERVRMILIEKGYTIREEKGRTDCIIVSWDLKCER